MLLHSIPYHETGMQKLYWNLNMTFAFLASMIILKTAVTMINSVRLENKRHNKKKEEADHYLTPPNKLCK